MAKQKRKKQENDFEFTINMKGREPLTVHDVDLRQSCWDYVVTLEQVQSNVVICSRNELLDSLLQSYFTWKLIYTENGLEISEEMKEIQNFISKHLEQNLLSNYLEELKQTAPAIQF